MATMRPGGVEVSRSCRVFEPGEAQRSRQVEVREGPRQRTGIMETISWRERWPEGRLVRRKEARG